jgi:hypothetical protein
MLVKLHVIFLLGALLDERKKKTYTKQPMVKFASAPGGYFNYIYLIKPSESISDKHPIQKHHVLYFQLITIFKKICGQTFFFGSHCYLRAEYFCFITTTDRNKFRLLRHSALAWGLVIAGL